MDSPSSDESVRDVALDKELETLRRACLSPTYTSASPSAIAASNSDSDSESDSDADEDASLLLRLRAQLQHSPPGSPTLVQPLSMRPSPPFHSESLPPVPGAAGGLDDDNDDYETLRNIQRMLVRYEAEALKSEATSTSSDPVQEPTKEDYSDTDSQFDHMALIQSKKFPKSAQMLVEALKKNRSCQKFVRRKLIEVETKIEENKELHDRVKCLVDFQVACKKKVGRALTQKWDPRVRLISFERLKGPQEGEAKNKKSALYFGPRENWWALEYKKVQEQFPMSLKKQPWSGSDKEKLLSGIKQQYQHLFERDTEGAICLPGFINMDYDITAEKMRNFVPFVNWELLASTLTGRSGAECESRWLNCEDPLINHEPWTRQEEKKLLFIAQNRGFYNWIDISVELGTNRTPFQCLARYQRSLNSLIMNRDWTKEEDMQLLALVETFGEKNWQLIAAHLKGRVANQCANRWRNTLNPKRAIVGRWSLEEDKRLKAAIMLFGNKCWNRICHFVPGRTQPQCRERWVNCLDPALNHKPWSQEEDSMLLEAVEMHGHCWSKITNFIPSRTDNQCWRRWKLLCPQENMQLQATRKIKRTALISNFVDRQSERPEVIPDDFAFVPEMNYEETNKTTVKRKPRKARLRKRKYDNNAKEAVEENPMDNSQNNPSAEQCNEETSIVGDPVVTTAPALQATVGKQKRRSSTALENGNNNNGTPKKRKRVRRDPWWVHAEILEGTRTQWKCKYCNRVFKGGGVFRLKMHIAGFVGDVASCPVVPHEIRESIKTEWEKQGKKPQPRKRKKGTKKEEVTTAESDRLQIGAASGEVPAAQLEKHGKKCTSKRKKQKEKAKVKERDADTMDRDVEKQGLKPEPEREGKE